MSAARHIVDCEREAKTLAADACALLTALRSGQAAKQSDLEHLQRLATSVLYHASRANYDLARMPQIERRAEAVAA